ncbi:MAG: UbiA family prenyltransferase [Thermodesulfobacteriota bacterium]
MDSLSLPKPLTPYSRLRLFLALSRTPHAMMDMATPGLAALLFLDGFPPLGVTLIGLVTVFAGYTSVYALNDLMDYPTDRIKVQESKFAGRQGYLDSAIVGHPLARGLLGFRESLSWVIAWAVLALLGACLLHPICALIFLGGCALEAVYCLLWRVSYLRAIVSGAVKTSGAMAAVFAVDSAPPPAFLMVLFLWVFFWEIGAQHIPADWAEIEEDRRLDGKTIPVRFGPQRASQVILAFLVAAVLMSTLVLWVAPLRATAAHTVIFVAVGVALLLHPAYRLYRRRDPARVAALFNRASYYPLALLIVVAMSLLFSAP